MQQLQKESWKNINRSPSYYQKRETHYGKNAFWDTGILVVFWRFLWAKVAKLSLIDFNDPYVNDGQKKLEVDT